MTAIPAPTRASGARAHAEATGARRSRWREKRPRHTAGSVPTERGAYREITPTLEQIEKLDHAGLAHDLQGVDVLSLPHRETLETGFGEPLDGIRVLGGPLVAETLDTMDTEGAAVGERIFLRDDRASLDTVAHEVVHVLQTRSSVAGAPLGVEQAAAGGEDSPVEHEAERIARLIADGGPTPGVLEVRAPLDPSRTALRTTAVKADRTDDKDRQRMRDALVDDTPGTETEELTTAAVADEATELEVSPARDEAPQPTFEPPAMPETALSPEEQAARRAQLAEAEAAIAQADTGSGVVGAFADAPPSVKASVQATLGARMQQTVAAEEQNFQGELPELKAKMGGELEGEALPPVQAPTPHDISLETGSPPPAPDPMIEPTPAADAYRANDAIASQVSRLFGGNPATAVGQSLSAVSTTDPHPTTPGPPPTVPLEGENDPARLDGQREEAGRQSATERDAAMNAVLAGPGPERAQLRRMDESYAVGELAQPELAGVAPAEGAAAMSQMALPEEVLARFDQDEHAAMQASVAAARGDVEQAEQTRDYDRDARVAQTEADREKLVEQADSDQRAEVLGARTKIQRQRQATIDDQAQAVQDLEAEADRKRGEDRGAIDERVQQDEERIDERYRQTEEEARARVEEGEREAESEKRKAEREAENESWWDRAVSFVKEAFAALTAVIGAIFDKIREAVNSIIDKAKEFAKGLIDLAADFIKKTIAAFGEVLKGLVTVLLADTFPGLARRLNEAIDGAVELANQAVDFVADKLKAGVEALAGALQAALNKILDVFQGAINFALGALEAVLTGDWSGVARKVLEAVLRVLGIDPAEFYALVGEALDTVKIIVDAPGKFIGHLIDAAVLGFQKFADNFLTHLKAGVIKWLTGALGDIQIPERFDLAGVLDLGRQILGITWDWIKKKAAKLIGEKNVERLEFVFSYVETLREGGFSALFERIKDELTGLAESVIGQIKEFLVTKLILAGIKWLASLFSPVGAIVKLVMTIWNFIQFLREQLARMIEVAKAVISSIANIARGAIETAGTRVEQVLGNLLPIAIDLVAKLLGLTGVSKKVREVIGKIREKFDKAVDKLIAKVMGRFKGKRSEKDAEGEKTVDGEIRVGEVVTVPVPDGPAHTLLVDVSGTDATPVMRSKELPVARWLSQLRERVDAIEDDGEKKTAVAAWNRADNLLKELEPLSDRQVSQNRQALSDRKPAPDDKVVDDKQVELGRALADVFRLVGGEETPILDVFSKQVSSSHKLVRTELKNALQRNADAWITLPWAKVRETLPEASDIFRKPMLSAHAFGSEWSRVKVLELVDVEHDALVPDKDRKDFLSYGLARQVHKGSEAEYGRLLSALRQVEFGDRKEADAELKVAVEKAAQAWSARDKMGPDEDLKTAAAGHVLDLLKAVGSNQSTFKGLDLKQWDARLWGQRHNQEWIKGQFRGRGGQHEWIPTSYVPDVVARAKTAASDEGVTTATRWIEFQDALRSPTKLLIFDPNIADYRRTVKHLRDVQTGERDKAGSHTVLQGHIGAVYAPADADGYRESVIGQTKSQGPWHDDLRGIFNAAKGIESSRTGMQKILRDVEEFADKTLWQGGSIPDPGFEEYYPAAQTERDPSKRIGFSKLESRAASAKKDIEANFAAAAKAAGF